MEEIGNSLFHGFTGSSQFLNSSHSENIMNRQAVVCLQNHRKTRKHQRFLKRKALLQKRRLLNRMENGSHEEIKHKNTFSASDQTKQSGSLVTDDSLDNQYGKLNDIKTLLGTLSVIPACSSANTLHMQSHDYDSGLSLPGSCASSRPSSPVAWLKPGKCVAIDCEMVGTGPGGRISELARCSVVNYRGDVVYDKYIKPELPITDFRTPWSGVTKRHMKNAISFKVAQKEILKILEDKRVVGHALHNDFKALKYFHPRVQTRDTSKIPMLNKMAGFPAKVSCSLKSLAWSLLHKRIQVGRMGHSSIEDAQTAMELYKLVEEQWEEELLSCLELSSSSSPALSSVSDNEQYMEDQYWPPDLNEDCK